MITFETDFTELNFSNAEDFIGHYMGYKGMPYVQQTFHI